MQGHTRNLFDDVSQGTGHERLVPGAWLLRGFALERVTALMPAIEQIQTAAPFRHLVTPGGFRMSVAMTNCGSLGWVSDRRGYRYDACDPLSGRPWPPMPQVFLELARSAAQAGGVPGFTPHACLLTRHHPRPRLPLPPAKDRAPF